MVKTCYNTIKLTTMEKRSRGAGFILFSLLAFIFLLNKWRPLFIEYKNLNEYSFVNWERQLVFLSLSLLGMLMIVLFMSGLFIIINRRHYCNIEIHAALSTLFGITVGGFFMLIFILIGKDFLALNALMACMGVGYLIGILLGIKAEIEEEKGGC